MAESIKYKCQQSSTMFIPVEESDTDLVQIDAKELSIELSNPTNESASIYEDMHNHLPEHFKISTMKRNKCKRNRQNWLRKTDKIYPSQSPKTEALNTSFYYEDSQEDKIA
nr:hypothetical protein HmN_000935500 [Hymenolepis microstoma]